MSQPKESNKQIKGGEVRPTPSAVVIQPFMTHKSDAPPVGAERDDELRTIVVGLADNLVGNAEEWPRDPDQYAAISTAVAAPPGSYCEGGAANGR